MPEVLDSARRRRVVGPLHPALFLAALTVLSGAFVAGLDAGQTFNTFPLMDGQWVPDGMLDLRPIWRNPFENVPMVQFDHRVLGILTMLACLFLWWRGQGADLRPAARTALNLIGLMALVQPALGIVTLLLVVPVSLAAAHQAGAMVLLGLLIWLLHETKHRPGRLDYARA